MDEAGWEETLFFRALRRRPTSRRPIWLMRQAGRYLPEYRALREKAGGFLPMIKNPETACEIALQPIRRFDFDAAILFSDILTIPDAMGLGLHFVENEGPRFHHPLSDERAVLALRPPPPGALDYVAAACRETRRALPKTTPLIGFCGSPWTLACYMIDGGGGGFWRARAMLHSRPELLKKTLAVNAAAVAELLCLQIENGAQAAMIFDSWGGLLAGGDYEDFSLSPIREAVATIKKRHPKTPLIVFARGGGLQLPAIAACGCDAVGVDWPLSLKAAQRIVGERTAIQGNMDPAALLADPAAAAAAAKKTLSDFGDSPGHIFNLGHGVDKTTPPDNVQALTDTVRAHTLPSPQD